MTSRPGCLAGLIAAFALHAAAAAPAGSACAQCHAREASRFAATPMAHALRTADDSDLLRRHTDLRFQEGPYQSRILRTGDRSVLTVTDGVETLSAPLLWAFGRGQAGQTYVFEIGGSLYESRLSFYNALGKLDLTMGAMGSKPQNLTEAAGRRMDSIGARECFGCHSSGGVQKGALHFETLSPGVACESCHESAERHAAAVRAGDLKAARPPRLSGMAAESMSELCGRCHRTWAQIAAGGPRGVNNVRFQPYRLANSKCFDAADPRISCAACHDPHDVLQTDLAAYDSKCTACHSASGGKPVCRTAKAVCASCHMPRIELPGAHARFTDHQIRIAKPGMPYPN